MKPTELKAWTSSTCETYWTQILNKYAFLLWSINLCSQCLVVWNPHFNLYKGLSGVCLLQLVVLNHLVSVCRVLLHFIIHIEDTFVFMQSCATFLFFIIVNSPSEPYTSNSMFGRILPSDGNREMRARWEEAINTIQLSFASLHMFFICTVFIRGKFFYIEMN